MKAKDRSMRTERKGRNGNVHVTQSNHADGLPDAQAYTGRHTPVEALEAIRAVDVLEGLADSQVLRPAGVLGLALHLNADNLDRLVPGGETTTKARSQDLLEGGQLLAIFL